MILVAESTLGADAASLTVSGLDLSPYVAAQVVIKAQAVSGAWDRCILRFNDDDQRNYLWFVRNHNSTTADSSNEGTYIAGLEAAHMSGPDVGTDFWGFNIIDIGFPGADDCAKSVIVRGGEPEGAHALATYGAGVWENEAPITSITLVPNAGGTNLKAGTTMQVYGLGEAELPAYIEPSPADDFNRANGAPGWPWLTFSPTPPAIVSNKLHFSIANNDLAAIWNGYTFPDDQYSEITFSSLSSGWLGPSVRASLDNQDNYIVIAFGGFVEIYKRVGTVYSTIGSSVAAAGLVDGDVVRLSAVGDLIRSYVNGVLKCSVTDATHTSGQPGIAAYDTSDVNAWAAGSL